jgi:hypothetical protein
MIGLDMAVNRQWGWSKRPQGLIGNRRNPFLKIKRFFN